MSPINSLLGRLTQTNPMEIAASLSIAQSTVTKQAAMYSIAKKQNDIETGLLDMLMNVALSAPPPGQGSVVDKTA